MGRRPAPRDEQVTVVLVMWADAYADEGGSWVNLRDVADYGEYLVTSAGILLSPGLGAQTGHVSIVQSWGRRDDCGDHIIHIPIGMVRSVRVMSPGKETEAVKLLRDAGAD
jgi:hypothetical protein